ncbi:biotin/lipoyl-binding protein [Ellagibacter isourolithinifaciens]|uniref:biotin/lipoyl-binding protein n=1 Tax=Ellagibacter isourolithinifaciens TaxID=2137581 RepID=UPI003A94C31A
MPNVPTITPGPDDTEHTLEGPTETIPLITDVHADKQDGRANDTAEISDEEAYTKLKAKRAERRRKKLIRRGIAAGVVGAIALIAVIATLVINAQPQGASGPVTDMVTEGTFTTTVEAKGQLKPISSSVVSPSVDGTVDSINVQAGQSVNEGDVLLTIKNDELNRNVAEAQRAVAAAQEDLANAQKAQLPHRPPQRRTSMELPLRLASPPHQRT